MLNTVEELKKEHEFIEQTIDEIEVAVSAEAVNYSNLVHCFRQLIEKWDAHEIKEEDLFRKLKEKNYRIPFRKLLFDHGRLARQKNIISRAISSGNEFRIKAILESVGKKMSENLKAHINEENEIIYRLPADILEGKA